MAIFSPPNRSNNKRNVLVFAKVLHFNSVYLHLFAFIFPFAKTFVLYSECEPYLFAFHIYIYITFFSD